MSAPGEPRDGGGTGAAQAGDGTGADQAGAQEREQESRAARPEHGVRITDATLHDARRGQDVRVRVHSPEAAGHFPCVVFCHGFGASRLNYGFLGNHLAARGFVSVHPTHAGTDVSVLANYSDAKAALQAAISDPTRWLSGARDVVACLDALSDGRLAPGQADPSRAAVAGHSFGAFTTLLVAGARLDAAGMELTMADERPRAFLALSPPGLGERGLVPGSLAQIARPVLLAFGTADEGPRGQPPSWRREAFDDLPPGNKVELILAGAPHETFAGLPSGATQPDPAHLITIQRAAVAFLRAHLCNQRESLVELKSLEASVREK